MLQGGVVLLAITLCMQVGYNSASRKLSVDVGGAKKLHALSSLVQATILFPWATFIYFTKEVCIRLMKTIQPVFYNIGLNLIMKTAEYDKNSVILLMNWLYYMIMFWGVLFSVWGGVLVVFSHTRGIGDTVCVSAGLLHWVGSL